MPVAASKLSNLAQSHTARVVARELKRRLPSILLIASLMLIQTALSLVPPLLLKILFDRAIPTRDATAIVQLLVVMVLAPILSQAIAALREHRTQSLGLGVSDALRTDLFGHLIRARILDVEKFKSGEIVFRLTRLCGQIGELYVAQEVLPLISSATVFVGTLLVMLAVDRWLSLILLAALPLSYLLTRRLSRSAKAADSVLYGVLEAGQSYLQEVFVGLRTVRAFNGQDYERGRWRLWNERHREASSRSSWFHIPAFLSLGSSLINSVFTGLVFGYGALRVVHGQMTVGALVSFVAYIPRIYFAFEAMLRAQVGTQRVQPAIDKLDELYAIPPEEATPSRLPVTLSAPIVEFSDVSFHYSRGAGVEGLSFRVQPGEFLGIVGPSGGGKTTIVDLLLGFHPPESGSISVDGVDIRRLSLESLREHIGYVPQDVFLWHASIRDNLSYPERGYPPEKLAEACTQAEILEFIQSQPDGFDTVVGERGLAISAGERQRLALARALLRQSPIILLDEATASLDAITEGQVRRALDKLRVGRTTIVVAHRLSTVLPADRILVIDRGRIVEYGTPKELYSQRGLFHSLCQAQALSL